MQYEIKQLNDSFSCTDYQARHKLTKELFVVKMIDLDCLSRRRQEKQKMKEQILESCSHPNIEKFIESFEVKGRRYIVSQHVPSSSLIEHI